MNTINEINFTEHGGIHGKQLGVFMPGGYWVPKNEVILAWDVATAEQQGIDWAEKVCAETFMHPEIWRQFSKAMKFRLGRCIKYFCDHEMLPIEVANPGKKGKRFYRRKQ